MTRRIALFATAALWLASPLPTLEAAAFAQEATSGVFHGVGVVTGVDRAKGWLTVNHGAIKGYMAAMEMTYRTDPPTLANGVKVGEHIDFDIDAARQAIVAVKPATP